MVLIKTEKILCPRCNSDAVYKYGRAKTGKQRYLCIMCNKQFTLGNRKEEHEELICELCGNKMYVYMRDDNKKIIRFRCSDYPKCKNYKIRRLI